MEDWNDLRLVLAVARAGGLSGAARALGVNHSTAFRRLNAFEERLGARLFERLPGGAYAATAAGERVAAAAERMETETAALDRDIAGRDHRLTGRVRLTMSETFAFRLITPLMARFRALYPGVLVELLAESRLLNLSRREADVALRAARPREGDLFGRRLCDVAWTVYGSPKLFAEHGAPRDVADLARFPFIGWGVDTVGVGAAEWVEATASSEQVVYRSNSLVHQMVAAREGIGLAALPCYHGDPEAGLLRALTEPVPALSRELWVVTHEDLRRTARVRACLDVIGEGIAAQRALIEGARPA
ncbi:LysR family transcriptional regulator [Falsiroseomonas oryziterrae]|uniref:LysR family transcriptional regulator n=1 Tax=Falsiroseomonas oryziterrae TaxID=2911368 RepID=UPI001F3E399D|nr:LysR family transcriptional regulator [Roseomonas sp. NPKOSM-4]